MFNSYKSYVLVNAISFFVMVILLLIFISQPADGLTINLFMKKLALSSLIFTLIMTIFINLGIYFVSKR